MIRFVYFLFGLTILIAVSCKSKKVESSVQKENNQVVVVDNKGKTSGTVSHRYRDTGCQTVINIDQENGETLILIPSEPIPEHYDFDGKEIFFNYQPLKMPQPENCNAGIPALITEISEK